MNRYNKVEFDFESWSWHGIEDDIMNAWCKRFGEDIVGSTLVNLREWLKKKPDFEETIETKYAGNWVYFIWNCLEKNEEWKREKNYQEYKDYENYPIEEGKSDGS